MPHYMIDLETFDTEASSVITSVGIVKFNKDGIDSQVEYHLPVQQQLDVGRTVSASTLLWWMQQDDNARNLLVKGQNRTKYLPDTLRSITHFIQGTEEDQAVVWGNGAAFDNVKLASLYTSFNMQPPWEFWNDRCYRTLKAAHKNIPYKRVGTHHAAVDDAKTQALHLIHINKATNGLYL